jgi:DTW domain-containing protein YfiP
MTKLQVLRFLLFSAVIYRHVDLSSAKLVSSDSFRLNSLTALCSYSESVSSFQEKLESTSSVSLSDMLSSLERYANSLDMTLEQVQQRKDWHRQAHENLSKRLQSKYLSGKEKHELMCQHRLQYGRHPFACPKCWSYLPVCVCHLAKPQSFLTNNLQVVVWTHHREWGLTSNTGSILSLTLSRSNQCRLLMKGLPEHDRILQDTILKDKTAFPIVLWPSDQSNDKHTITMSLKEVQEELETNPKRRVVLIAVDGTWRNARRMVARLPPSTPRLDLPEHVVFPSVSDDSSSILAPLRSRGESGQNDDASEKRQVCTAEAVVGALQSLGALDPEQAAHILEVTRTKVDRIKRYRGRE